VLIVIANLTAVDDSRSAKRPSDAELMRRYCGSSDNDAFAEILRRYGPELRHVLYRMVGPSAADDLLQSTLLRFHTKRNEYIDGRPLRPWLLSIATHLAIDWMRHAGRTPALSLDDRGSAENRSDNPHSLSEFLRSQTSTPLELAGEDEACEWVRSAVSQLPENLHSAVLLVFLQGLKYSEAADVLGVPIGTVKSRVHHALKRLQHADVPQPKRNGKSRKTRDSEVDFRELNQPAQRMVK
jgi:RNA polymerase sigma-70 factor (ECF subfamily)